MRAYREVDNLDFTIDAVRSHLEFLYMTLASSLKKYIIVDLARLSKKHVDKEVMLTCLCDATRLHIAGEETTAPICAKVNYQREKHGVDVIPIGVFLAYNDHVSFQPIADS